jgi:hypothetical protein
MNIEFSSIDNSDQGERDTQSAPNRLPPGLTEDAALALIKNADVTPEALAQLAKNPIASKSRKIVIALASNSRTPRHISIPLLRGMFTFDLMNLALTPAIAPDVKRAAEEQLIMRLESLPVGQKITLARQGSGRVAAALLQTPDQRIISPALENRQLTEALVVQALMKPRAPERLFVLVSDHPSWQLRREIQVALLRSGKTPLERAREFANNFSKDFLSDILPDDRMSLLVSGLKEAETDLN